MKKLSLIPIIILMIISNTLYAVDIKWDITGQLVEEQSGETIPYANVALYNKLDSSLLAGTTSNFEGEFSLEGVNSGDYFIKISFIGFEDYYIHKISFEESSNTIELGQLRMYPAMAMLEGVEITGKISPVTNTIDKQVLNVEKNLSASGGTAVDALRLSPSITTDAEGGVKLRGSSNFIVLINGKPTTLTSDQVLRQTPANQISKIEIITAPSVKYNAEGGAGVINIILRKNVDGSFNGMINASVGTKDKYTGDVSLNLNHKKISFSIGMDWRDYTKTAINNYYRDLTSNGETHRAYLGQERTFTENNLGFRLGVDYNPNEKNNFNYALHTGYTSTELDIIAHTSGKGQSDDTSNNMYNTEYFKQKPRFITNNLSFIHQFDDKGSNLSINGYYSYIDYFLLTSQIMSEADQDFNPIDSTPYMQDVLNENYSHDARLDVDYTYQLSEKTSIEVGTSFNKFNRYLDITYAEFNYDEEEWINHPDYTNKYSFKEDVFSYYANFNFNFWGIQTAAGFRVEYMDRILQQESSAVNYKFNRLNYFPGFSFSKAINDKHSVKFANSNRINRPDEYMMNPFPEYEDEFFYSEGNPFLIPEIVRSTELSYQFAGDKTMFSASAYYRTTTDKIEQKLTLRDDDKIAITFHNDVRDQSIGLELMGNFDINDWWSLNANTNTYHYTIEGGVEGESFSRKAFSWSAQLVSSFTIKENTSIQLIGYYNSKTVRSQGELSHYYFVDSAVKHQFLNGKLSLSLQWKDMLQSLNYQLITGTENMHLVGDFNNESPIFILSVSYQISKYHKKTKDTQTDFDM